MKDLIDYPLTISAIQKDLPDFDFIQDVLQLNPPEKLQPLIQWLAKKNIVIETRRDPKCLWLGIRKIKGYTWRLQSGEGVQSALEINEKQAFQKAILQSFCYLENLYLKRLL